MSKLSDNIMDINSIILPIIILKKFSKSIILSDHLLTKFGKNIPFTISYDIADLGNFQFYYRNTESI